MPCLDSITKLRKCDLWHSIKNAKRHILWKYSQMEGEWSPYWEGLFFWGGITSLLWGHYRFRSACENLFKYTKKSWFGQKTPPLSRKCQNFPFEYYGNSSLISLIEDKGKRFNSKRVYLSIPNPGSYYNMIYFTNVLSPLQML